MKKLIYSLGVVLLLIILHTFCVLAAPLGNDEKICIYGGQNYYNTTLISGSDPQMVTNTFYGFKLPLSDTVNVGSEFIQTKDGKNNFTVHLTPYIAGSEYLARISISSNESMEAGLYEMFPVRESLKVYLGGGFAMLTRTEQTGFMGYGEPKTTTSMGVFIRSQMELKVGKYLLLYGDGEYSTVVNGWGFQVGIGGIF